jgi:hypothetical protein
MFRITAFAGALLCLLTIGIIPANAETCVASQYGVGDGYHGRRTASGDREWRPATGRVPTVRPMISRKTG